MTSRDSWAECDDTRDTLVMSEPTSSQRDTLPSASDLPPSWIDGPAWPVAVDVVSVPISSARDSWIMNG